MVRPDRCWGSRPFKLGEVWKFAVITRLTKRAQRAKRGTRTAGATVPRRGVRWTVHDKQESRREITFHIRTGDGLLASDLVTFNLQLQISLIVRQHRLWPAGPLRVWTLRPAQAEDGGDGEEESEGGEAQGRDRGDRQDVPLGANGGEDQEPPVGHPDVQGIARAAGIRGDRRSRRAAPPVEGGVGVALLGG